MAFSAPDVLIADETRYVEWGRAIARGSSAGSAQAVPLYPAFLGIVFSAFGPALVYPRIAHAILGALTVALTHALGARLFGRRVGFASGLLLAALPEMAGFSALFYTENLALPLVVASLLLVSIGFERERRWLPYAAGGIIAGLAILTREVVLPFVVVAAPLILVCVRHVPLKHRIGRALLFLLPALALTALWMCRNLEHYGCFSLTANRWKVVLEGNAGPGDLEAHRALLARDEFAAEDFARERAWERIRDAQPAWIVTKGVKTVATLFSPKNFLYREIRRAGATKKSVGVVAIVATPYLGLVLVGALLGLCAVRFDRRVALLLAFAGSIVVAHVASDAVTRHRLLLLPVLSVLAGWFWCAALTDRALLSRLRHRGRSIAAAALVVGLAAVWLSAVLGPADRLPR